LITGAVLQSNEHKTSSARWFRSKQLIDTGPGLYLDG